MIQKKKTNKTGLELSKLEKSFLNSKYSHVIGIDEVGRGALAGPMIVCGFVYSQDDKISQSVNDSKIVSKKKRIELHSILSKKNHYIVSISPKNIDTHGLTKSFSDAVVTIYKKLMNRNSAILVDGNQRFPNFDHVFNVINGDATQYSIAAASIIAKVHRDNIMCKYSKKYPEYGFDTHVGYGTKKHMYAIQHYGVLEIHRRCYKPIQKVLKYNEKKAVWKPR